MPRSSHEELRGQARRSVAAQLAARFQSGETTIAELASEFRRRPSLVRRLLTEAGLHTDDHACVGAPDDEVVSALADRYVAGESIVALARDTGIDRRTVRHLLQEAQIVLRGHTAAPTNQVDGLARRYRSGATLRELAEETGCSVSAVRKVLLDAGVSLRGRGERRRR